MFGLIRSITIHIGGIEMVQDGDKAPKAMSLGGSIKTSTVAAYCPEHGCKLEKKKDKFECPECGGPLRFTAVRNQKFCIKHGRRMERKEGHLSCPECVIPKEREKEKKMIKFCPKHGCRVEERDDGAWCTECNGPIIRRKIFCKIHGCRMERRRGKDVCPDCPSGGPVR